MDKKKVLISIIVVSVLVVVFVNAIYFNISKNENILSPTQPLIVDNYEIKVADYYEADYAWSEDLDYTFDKYLAVDLSIKNIGDTKDKFQTFGHFRVEDGNYNLKSMIIDENKKKFGKELYPDDTFNITLTFPVDNSNKYILYYNKTLKEEDEKKYGFELDGTHLKKKTVDKTTDHFSPKENGVDNHSEEEAAKDVLDVASGEPLDEDGSDKGADDE